MSPKLDSALTQFHDLLYDEEFERVKTILDSLKNTNYYKNKFDKLAIEAKEAQYLYEDFRGEKAIKLLLNGLQQLKKYPNSKLFWEYNYVFGKIYKEEKLYDKALELSNICIKNALNRKDTLAILRSYNLKGGIFWGKLELLETDNYEFKKLIDSASFYQKKSLKSKINNTTIRQIIMAYMNMSVYESYRDLKLSKEYINKAIEIESKLKNIRFLTSILNQKASLYYENKEFNKAIIDYKKAHDLIKDIYKKRKFLSTKNVSLQNISWAYNELGDYKNAYKYQELATELRDSLDILKRSRNIAAIEAKYKEEQKVIEEKNKRLQSEVHFYSVAILSILLAILGYIIYRRLALKQKKTEQKITRLKYKALNAQMNPHFINNLLSAIQKLISKNDKEQGGLLLKKFNKLTNLVLRSTKSNLIPLSEELTMLQLYLDLQLVRFHHKFNYHINTTSLAKKDIDCIKIPPLILQPIVENTITHGLSNITQKGNITIDFNITEDQYLKCTITDNGTQQKNDSLGNGISLKNINERLQLINQIQNNLELVNFQTIKNQKGETIGAKTTLNIPLIYG